MTNWQITNDQVGQKVEKKMRGSVVCLCMMYLCMMYVCMYVCINECGLLVWNERDKKKNV